MTLKKNYKLKRYDYKGDYAQAFKELSTLIKHQKETGQDIFSSAGFKKKWRSAMDKAVKERKKLQGRERAASLKKQQLGSSMKHGGKVRSYNFIN
jgi:hypothetical protein